MKGKNLRLFLATFLAIVCMAGTSQAVSWIDWTSTTNGTLTVGGSNINVTLSGPSMDLVNGDYYYNNASTGGTSPLGTYGGLEPTDLIRTADVGRFTLTFDAPVVDLYMALVSVGQPWNNYYVTYSFSDAFSVVSSGPNYWGYGGYSVIGNDFSGLEYNGILEFEGAFTSLSFSISPSEYWHGFNFGAGEKSAAVPEPATMILLGAGLVGIAAVRRRNK